jgi:hypothetical protein
MSTTTKRKREHFRPTVFKLMATDDKLTAAAGLATIMEVYDQHPISRGFAEALPERVTANSRSGGSYRLGLIQLNSFIYGHDCLDDIEEFRGDPLLEAAMKGEVAAPRTIGDWLRDFLQENIEKLSCYCGTMARNVRKELIEVLPEEFKPNRAITIDMDSTSHVQCGEKMEGLAWNYKDEWGLYSEVAFDELGLCHGMQLAPGNTKPGSTCVPLIEQCFAGMKYGEEKYFRGDSAYCYEAVLRALMRLGVTYVVAAHDGTSGWKGHIDEVTEWTPWVHSDEEIEKAAKRKRELPKVELGRFYWEPSWAPNIKIPVIVKRTWKDAEQLGFLENPAHWDYYGVVTNFDLFHNSLQSVMEFYQKRGNAERFIREEKYGFDLKHFPCQSLRANHAFALLAMVAHNLLRWVAIVQKPDKPHFSKKIRRRFVYIPGKIVHHARQVYLKIPVRFHEEVSRLLAGLRYNPTKSATASGFA